MQNIKKILDAQINPEGIFLREMEDLIRPNMGQYLLGHV